MEKRERELYLDVIKVCGGIAIVALHTLSNTLHSAYGAIPILQRGVIHVLHQCLYTAVPVFILATGSGFLAQEKRWDYHSMWKHTLKIFNCIILFGCLFWTIEAVVTGVQWSLPNMVIAVLTDCTWSHMWYLYKLLGIYLCIPVLSVFVRNSTVVQLAYCVALLFFLQIAYPYIGGIIGFIPASILPIDGSWLFYVLMGGLLGRLSLNKTWHKWALGIGMAVSLGGIVLTAARGEEYILLEDFPFTAVFAVCLFGCTKVLFGHKKSNKIIEAAGKAALGVYIIHPVFLQALVRITGWNPQLVMPVISIPLTVILIYLCSLATVVLVSKIGIIKKYLF